MKRVFHPSSLFMKLTGVFLAVVAILCAVYLYSYVSSMNLLQSEKTTSLANAGRSQVQTIDRQIANAKRAIYNLYSLQDWNSLAMAHGYVLDYDVLQQVKAAEDRIRLLVNDSEILSEVVVHFPRWGRSISANLGLVDYDAERWEGVSMPRNSVGAQIVYRDGSAYLTTRYQTAGPALYGVDAVLSFERSYQAFGDYAMMGVPLNNYLYDTASGNLLYRHEEFGGEADAFLADRLEGLDLASGNPATLRFGGDRYLVLSASSSYSRLRVVNIVRPSDLIEPFARQTRLVILFTALMSLSLVLTLAYLRHSIVRPVERMVQAFKPVEQGDFSVSLAPTSNDEFATLYRSFNHMVENLHVLVNEVYQKELLVQRASLKQLQSQISPHFLYNSLYALSAMIKIGDNENAERFCMYLSNYFRYITRSDADLVPLADEWRHAENYLNIMAMRSGTVRVEFQEELPAGVRDLQVPRLIVQPIVENAFVHGGKSVKTFHLRVTAAADADRVLIRVEDNGTGTDDRLIEAMNDRLQDLLAHEEVTGLMNIHRRLRIVFGPEAGLSASRSELGGVCVTETLVRKGGDEDDL